MLVFPCVVHAVKWAEPPQTGAHVNQELLVRCHVYALPFATRFAVAMSRDPS